jgi:aspartate kinase
MSKLVLKFGGTSVADVDCIRKAAQIIVNEASDGHEVLAVVSAMGDTTDRLISLAKKVSPSPSARELDMLLTTGEQQSVALMTMAIQECGGQAKGFTGGQAGIITENRHGSAKIEEIRCASLEASMGRGEIPVVAGFQGMSNNQELTTLGRGGSDTTAVAVATAISADRCDIYTDVNGVYTTDPRMVSRASKLKSISYEEMFEMANTGAKVINSRAVSIAKDSQMPVRIRSTFWPEDEGTLITDLMNAPDYPISGMTYDLNQVWFSWQMDVNNDQANKLDNVASLFVRLNELNISTDMVMLLAREDEPVQELVFTVEKDAAARVQSVIEAYTDSKHSKLLIDDRLARISVISRKLNGKPEIVASVFDALNHANIPVNMVATGDLRFSLLIPKTHAESALTLIHEHFSLSNPERN